MSKKRIVALIVSLAVIFGLGFAGYRAMANSTGRENNIYTTHQAANSSSAAESGAQAESKRATASEQTAATQTGKASADSTASNERVSGLPSRSGNKHQAKERVKQITAAQRSDIKTSKSSQNRQTTNTAACALIVRGPIKSGNRVLLKQSTITIHSGDTVASVLKRVAKAKHIAVSYQGSGTSFYVRGIAGLFEFDKGSGSGWLYAVNGKFPGYSSGKYRVKRGDKIQWLYTANLGKDRDAPQVSQK